MRGKLKFLVPIAAIIIIIAGGVLVFILTRPDNSKPKSKTADSTCSLLPPSEATQLLGPDTFLSQAKTSTIQNVKIVGCQYNNKHNKNVIVFGQRKAVTNYEEQILNRNFFNNVANGEVPIKFANYYGFAYKDLPANIRLWFKNTWLSVYSPNPKISETILTNFVKSH